MKYRIQARKPGAWFWRNLYAGSMYWSKCWVETYETLEDARNALRDYRLANHGALYEFRIAS